MLISGSVEVVSGSVRVAYISGSVKVVSGGVRVAYDHIR